MKINIKALLLKTNCFIENTYFELYVQLLENNLDNKKIKGYTNKHHCIPLTFFTTKYNKTRREAEFDSKQFGNITINLKFADHIKAHYYLALCMTEHYKYGAISALNYLIGNFNNKNPNYTIDFTLEDLQLDRYQELYELGSKLNALKHSGVRQNRTKEWNKKISISNTGKKKINNGMIEKAVNQEELQNYISNGWTTGPLPFSEPRKEKARQAVKKASQAARLVIVGDNNPAKRPEVRQKIRESRLGKKLSNETKLKISQTKLSNRKAKLIILNGITYYGVREAMQKLHISFYKLQNLMKESTNETNLTK